MVQVITDLLSKTDRKNFTAVLVITTIRAKIDSDLLYIIEKIGTVEKLSIPVTDSLKKWLDEKSELDGIKFTTKAVSKLIENVNFDLNLLKMEYEKLYTFIVSERDKTVNEKIVYKLVNRVYDMKIFDLVDFIGNRDKENAMKALKAISAEKQNIIGLITLIHRMFKAILFIKSQLKKLNSNTEVNLTAQLFGSEEEAKNYIGRYIGHSPYLLGKIINNYKKFSKKYGIAEIIKIFDILNRYDFLIRTSEVSENYLVTRLIIDIVDIRISDG